VVPLLISSDAGLKAATLAQPLPPIEQHQAGADSTDPESNDTSLPNSTTLTANSVEALVDPDMATMASLKARAAELERTAKLGMDPLVEAKLVAIALGDEPLPGSLFVPKNSEIGEGGNVAAKVRLIFSGAKLPIPYCIQSDYA